MADERKSSPPRAPYTEFEVAMMLVGIRSDIKTINDRIEKAEANDERFKAMEHDFRVAKWFTMIAGGAAIVALVTAFMGKVSFRSDPLPTSSSAERLGSDRVPAPRP